MEKIIVIMLILAISCIKQKKEVYNIGILNGLEHVSAINIGLKEKMSELGYKESVSIIYDIQKSNGLDTVSYHNIINDFINKKVDLIFIYPTEPVAITKRMTEKTGIPVVFANAFVEYRNLIETLREPGGNMTGVRWEEDDIALQCLEIFQELLPEIKEIWIPFHKNNNVVDKQLNALYKACKREKLHITELPAENASELDLMLKKIAQDGLVPDAIMLICEPLSVMADVFSVIGKFADDNNIPIGGSYISVNGYESIFGFRPLSIPQGRQAAFLVDKILKGTPAGSIPIVSADNYLILNIKKADKLGLKLSDALLGRANKIIR